MAAEAFNVFETNMGGNMSGWVRNEIETGIPTSPSDCRGIAMALYQCDDLKVIELRCSKIETTRGYSEEYICDPTLDDFMAIIDRDGWFLCVCESNWRPPNHFFKEMIMSHPGACIINNWTAMCSDECCGNDVWDKDFIDETDDEDKDADD